MTDTDSELRQSIGDLLAECHIATLATTGDQGPWAAPVFYASDPQLNLYFVSDHRTRHAGDFAAGGQVAAAVYPDCEDWGDIRGLQLCGHVDVLTGTARVAGLARYLARFPDVRALFERPQTPDEETIAQRLKAANLYRLRPGFIRLIDNRRGFGFKRELQLD